MQLGGELVGARLAPDLVGAPGARRLLEQEQEHVHRFDRLDVLGEEARDVGGQRVLQPPCSSPSPASSSTPSARITTRSTSSAARTCPSDTAASARDSAASTVPERVSLSARPLAVRPKSARRASLGSGQRVTR